VVPGENGRILFTRCIYRGDCTWEIVVADPDGSDEVVLAGPYPREAWDDHFTANWSPDGETAIFMAYQAIWQVNADGTHLHKIWEPPTKRTGIDDGPSFTPDGDHIVFTRCCPRISGYALWMINADGTGLRQVTDESVPPGVDGPSDNLPQVSPDGTRIAYHRNVFRNGRDHNRVVTVNMGGKDRIQLTPPSLNAQVPNWSPDSKRVVFIMFPPSGGIEAGSCGRTERTSPADAQRQISQHLAVLFTRRFEDHLFPEYAWGLGRPVHDEPGRQRRDPDLAARVSRQLAPVGRVAICLRDSE